MQSCHFTPELKPEICRTKILTILYRIRVAIPVYIYDTFDYTVSAEQYAQAQIGARVAISLDGKISWESLRKS